MIELTERQLAEMKINSIKEAVAKSEVDYYICETPYKLCINLRKKLLSDHSPKSLVARSLNTNVSSSMVENTSSLFSNLNDSGSESIINRCASCEESLKNMDDARKELVKTILDSKQTIEDLKKDNANKDVIIKNIRDELQIVKDQNKNIKIEQNKKADQLKKTNKDLEKTTSNYEKLKVDNENANNNYKKKIENLEKSIKNLNEKLCEKNKEIKLEKNKNKNLESKKKVKTKSTETDSHIFTNHENSSQTFSNNHSTETFTEEKVFLLLKDKIFSEIYLKENDKRDRSNSFPSISKYKIKKPSQNRIKKHSNPKEAPWDAIDPDSDAANALNLTRDIAGFYVATADNMRRSDLIEEMMTQMTNSTTQRNTRMVKTARRRICKETLPTT